jgi:AcrR family transcriptional regulator
MARRPERATRRVATSASPPGDAPPRERIIHAFMALLAERRIEEIGYTDIAARAGVSLAELRSDFGSKLAILAAHMKEIDRQVLTGGDADMADEPARERLFDVLMRRLEAMAPHREAIRSLIRSARRNPPLALALNGLAVRSQQWMLAAADVSTSGPRGMIQAQGLAVMFARVLRTFVRDEDEGLARTMASLDRELGRGQRYLEMLDGACRLTPLRCFVRRRSRRDDRLDSDEDPVAA